MVLLAQLALSSLELTILTERFFSSKVPKVSIVPSHFMRTAKSVSCFAHTNTILCKHSYYLSVLNR